MRQCIRCQAEMVEQCDIKVEGAAHGIVMASGPILIPIRNIT